MPEETETTEQQQDTGTEETVEETATEGQDGTEQQDTAQEAETGKQEEPFDRRKFEAELRKKNSEAANLRKRLKELEPAAAELQRIKDAEKSERSEEHTSELQSRE